MTHVLLPDDPPNKRRMLLALLGLLVPDIWENITEEQVRQIGNIAGYQGYEEAVRAIEQRSRSDLRLEGLLASARELRESILEVLVAVEELLDAGLLVMLDRTSILDGWAMRPWESPPS